MLNIFARLLKEKSGVTAIEYGLIASLIAVAIVTAVSLIGGDLNNTFTNVAQNL